MSDNTISSDALAIDSSFEVRIDVLARIGQAIETAVTIDELLLMCLYEMTHYFETEWGVVALLDEHEHMVIAGEYPPMVERTPAVPLHEIPFVQHLLEQREGRVIEIDPGNQNPYRDFLAARDARSLLMVPLFTQDRPLGVLCLGAIGRTRRFSTWEQMAVRVLASQIATAVASLRLQESARRRSEELGTLNEIAGAITSTLDTREVYRLVVQKLSAYFHVEAGSLLLVREPSGDLEFVMTIEGGEEKLAGVRVPAGRGIVGAVAQSGKWVIVHDAQNDPRFYSKVSDDLGFPTRSILCVPMLAKGRVMGVIELLNKHDGQFDEDEAERLTRMGAFIGVAIENARLFQQVADGRDRLAAIFDSTADGILMTDMHDVIVSANSMAEQVLEVLPGRLIGQSFDLLEEALRTRAHEVTSRQWGVDEHDTTTPFQVSEFSFAQGPHLYTRLLRLPVRDDHGVMYGQLIILRNITQERELEKLRDDYTNMLIHDLRAPLTSVMNGILMVQRELVGPVTPQQLELLKIAYQGSTTMLTLINNLLDIAKMEQGQLQLEHKPLVPYELVDRAIARLHASAQSGRVKVEQHLVPHLPLLEADDEKIVRVLQNLIDNALKFSPNGASVKLGIDVATAQHPLAPETPIQTPLPAGEWMVFWIQDHGRGIPAAYRKRIFEKFGQVRGQKVRGTGLGLAFCKLTVEAHGGQIWVESEEGHGSIFIFILPLS